MAVDFVSPESIDQCLDMARRLRQCPHDTEEPPERRFYAEKLQGGLMFMSAAIKTHRALGKLQKQGLQRRQ